MQPEAAETAPNTQPPRQRMLTPHKLLQENNKQTLSSVNKYWYVEFFDVCANVKLFSVNISTIKASRLHLKTTLAAA